MKKTLIALLTLTGVASAANYTYVGAAPTADGEPAPTAWAESATNWRDENGNLLGTAGLLKDSANSGKVSGSTFAISNAQAVKAGNNTGGFRGATVNIEQGGTLKIDAASAIYGANTTVNVNGKLVVNSGKTLGTTSAADGAATVNVLNGGILESIGKIERTAVVVAEGGTLKVNADTHIGAAEITLKKGAQFIAHDDLKLKGTTFTLEETLTLGNTWLDSNSNTGSATFNLGENGKVAFGTLSLNHSTWGSNTYTLSAICTNGNMAGDGDIVLFKRTLMTYSSLSNGSTDQLLSHIVGGEITLGDETMTHVAGNAEFNESALTEENVGQYRFLIEDNQLKVQYAAHLIPEPATATLSLLALAGLVARRRRK